jgi:hypothetical protein
MADRKKNRNTNKQCNECMKDILGKNWARHVKNMHHGVTPEFKIIRYGEKIPMPVIEKSEVYHVGPEETPVLIEEPQLPQKR